MADSITQKWNDYKPTKATWLWSCVGAAALTMIVGFTLGGWVTGGAAAAASERAVNDARAQLAATLCVDKFVHSAGAAGKLAELKEASTWDRDNMITDGGWTVIAGLEEPVDGAADLCAKRLTAMDSLPVANAEPETTTEG